MQIEYVGKRSINPGVRSNRRLSRGGAVWLALLLLLALSPIGMEVWNYFRDAGAPEVVFPARLALLGQACGLVLLSPLIDRAVQDKAVVVGVALLVLLPY